MDRFSRLEEDKVLNQVKVLSLVHNINIHAVNGDVWSELVESVGKLKEMGFIGEAISEFLEKILRGLEFQRAHRESQVKSERVKLAVRKKDGVTKSYKGNKWGRKTVSTQKRNELKEILKNNPNKSIRQIAKEMNLSIGAVHKYKQEINAQNLENKAVQDLVNLKTNGTIQNT